MAAVSIATSANAKTSLNRLTLQAEAVVQRQLSSRLALGSLGLPTACAGILSSLVASQAHVLYHVMLIPVWQLGEYP